jgi:hypothetical protein
MRARPLALVLLSLFAFVAHTQAQSAPSISILSQPLGPGNTPITITGSSFGASQGASFVTFGSTSHHPLPGATLALSSLFPTVSLRET